MTRALILGRHGFTAAFLLAAVALQVWTASDTRKSNAQSAAQYVSFLQTSKPLQALGQAPSAPRSIAVSASLPNIAIETSRGVRTSFSATGGYVRIAMMFYTHCPGLCPLTIDTLQSLERQLTAAERARLNILLLSLDPLRDSPADLRALENERRIDSNRWLVGRTSSADARAFAAALGIEYRTLDDGTVDHTSLLALLDAQGRVLARNSDTGAPDPQFIDAVRRALANK